MMQQLQQRTRRSFRRLVTAVGMPRSSFMRWAQRLRRGLPAISRGATRDFQSLEKAQPERAVALRADVAALRHGPRRSQGTGALYERVRPFLSRRAFNLMVSQHRQELARQKRKELTRIVWNVPGAGWATDPGQIAKRCWNLVSDMASRFRFDIALAVELPAQAIAAQLVGLFERYGAPLFLKRDNGPNLIAQAVDEVLDAFGVIALNSPKYYPRYNGAIERAQRELKDCAARLAGQGLDLDAALAIAPTVLDATPRPCLGDRTAAEVFFGTHTAFQAQFTPQVRKETKNSIEDHAERIRVRMKSSGKRASDAAWRQAVQEVLIERGLISVVPPVIVSPHSS